MMLRNEDMYVGQKIEAKFKNNPDATIFNCYIPLMITREYPKWWLAEVLPHKNPNRCWGMSKPYNMTIRKWDIKCGDVIIREGRS